MSSRPSLPPGFRFHPTDEELIIHYLRNRASSRPCPVSIIAEIDIYKFDPWDLPTRAMFGDKEWYFFSPRDRKYPNGARPNRAAASGYWKATGTDKPIISSGVNVGVKKALVFYKGKPPKGQKTNWIMHEYRLTENKNSSSSKKFMMTTMRFKDLSMRLDDWVLCRIYKKNNHSHSSTVPPLIFENHHQDQLQEDYSNITAIAPDYHQQQEQQQHLMTQKKSYFYSKLLEDNDVSVLSHLLDNPYNFLNNLDNHQNDELVSVLTSFSNQQQQQVCLEVPDVLSFAVAEGNDQQQQQQQVDHNLRNQTGISDSFKSTSSGSSSNDLQQPLLMMSYYQK